MFMKIVTLNIRGVRDRAKRRRLRSLIAEGKFQCCFLQETKCSNINRLLVESLWGGCACDWVGIDVVALAGGC